MLPTRNLGVQLGVKLPTGRYGRRWISTRARLPGTPLDASLQPGTGSTDVIVGAYYYRAISQDFDFFVNGQFQSAVTHHMDQPGNDYRPGNSTTRQPWAALRGAIRHWVPQVQLNLLHKSPDQGALADVQNTAGIGRLSQSRHHRSQAPTGCTCSASCRSRSTATSTAIQLFPRYTLSVGANYAL